MYARVTKARLKKEYFGEAASYWSEYMTKFKNRGLRVGYIMIDSKTSEMCSITVWKDAKSQEQFAQSRERIEALTYMSRFFEEDFNISFYDIRGEIINPEP